MDGEAALDTKALLWRLAIGDTGWQLSMHASAMSRSSRRDVGSMATMATAATAAGAILLAGCGGHEHRIQAAAPASSGRTGSAAPLPGNPGGTASHAASSMASTEPAGQFNIAFAGDVHFAERTATRLAANPATAFGASAAVLSDADLTMVNLETAIAVGGRPESKSFTFQAPPSAFTALADAGVDVVTMANNHAADYGSAGLSQTLAAIGHSGFPVVGIGQNAAMAYAPYYRTVNGVRIAIVAASQVQDETLAHFSATDTSPGIANAYSDRLVASVRAAKAHADAFPASSSVGFFLDHAGEAAAEHLAHHGVIVAGGKLGGLDVELAVLRLFETFRSRHDKGAQGMGALDMGIVIDLDAAGRLFQPEHVGHAFQQLGLGAVLGQAAAQLLAGIGQGAFHDLALFAALGGGDFHPVFGAQGQRLGQQFAVRQFFAGEDQFGRDAFVIELADKAFQHLAQRNVIGVAREIGTVAPILPGAEEEDLDAGMAAFAVQAANRSASSKVDGFTPW